MNNRKMTNSPGSSNGMNVPSSFEMTCSSIISGVISFFVFLIVAVFPLIYHDSYFDILETKYRCYYLCIIGMLIVCAVLALVLMFVDMKEYQGEHTKKLFGKLAPKNWQNTFGVADAAILIYWLAALISTFQSEYFYESFWGNEGRYTGLFLMTLYVASYFLISRCWKVRGWLLDVFLISGMIMCFIGITDYFQLDILQFRTHIKPEQSTMFTSTVGNINTYTAYVALIMGFAAAMFATAKSIGRIIWYYICLVVTFFAIVMGCSDNAYLALGALFAFLPFVLFRTWSGVFRYLVMAASFFTVTQCIDIINQIYADVVIGLDSLFRVIVGFLCGFVASIPIAFLMGWYAPVRNLVAPWIQFVRNIPPLAYIPLVIAGAGVGEKAKIIVIFIASFLVLVVTIYQGVCNVDVTLIKAARVLGATDKDIFFKVVIPASTPFILVGARLGLSTSLTTLVAAELTGASKGLGMMIQKAQGYYDMATVLMGILIIGIIGLTFEQIVRFLERELTGWQETM